MRQHKKEDIAVMLFVLMAVVSFTLIKDPNLTGHATAYFRIHGLGDIPGEEVPVGEENNAPIIYLYEPAEPIVIMSYQENKTFKIEKADPDNNRLTVKWYLNSLKVGEESDSFEFKGEDYELGNYNLTVIVSDTSLEDSKEWMVQITSESIGIEDCGKCCGVVCEDSSILCPEGFVATCKNSCDRRTGECSLCEATCALYPATDYISGSYDIPLTDRPAMVSRRTIPCINVTSERREVAISEANITDFMNMPKGHSMILSPFSIGCSKGNAELTLSIPKDYVDIKALRCKGINCYPTTVEKTRNLECGGRIVKEFTEKAEYLDPELMPIKAEKISLNFSSFKQALRTGNSQMWFYGDVFTNLSLTLSMPGEVIEEAKNPMLRTLNVLNVKVKAGDNVNSVIEMPYVLEKNIDEESIRMYAKTKEGWDYIGGKLDKEEKRVKAVVENIRVYLDENDEAKFALMGTICINCNNYTFGKVYDPKQKSREAVLLVHGFTSTPLTYQQIIDDVRLTEQPFQLWIYGYPTRKDIEISIEKLEDYLQEHSDEFDSMFIVGHSLGGLVVQQALYNSKNNPEKYDYVDKIKKLILVGVPNEGSPGFENQKKLLTYFANLKEKSFFQEEDKTFPVLVRGIITPKLEDISYYVIAGTKPISVNLAMFKIETEKLFGLYEKNDGIVTVKSAQRVGDEYINDMCNNYWEINLTHTQLMHEKTGRELVGRILSEELLSEEEQVSLLGNNQYFELKINDCSAEDKYVVIGRKIGKKEIEDPTGCSCGNGVCGVGEDKFNCPADCSIFLINNKYPVVPYIIGIIFLIISAYRFASIQRLKHGGNKKLISYIHDNYEVVFDAGISPLGLRKELKDKGFADMLFDDAFKQIYRDFFRKYLLLEEHVENKLLKKVPKKKIKAELLEKGWKEDVIEKAFNKEIIHLRFRKKGEKEAPKQIVKDDVKGRFFAVR